MTDAMTPEQTAKIAEIQERMKAYSCLCLDDFNWLRDQLEAETQRADAGYEAYHNTDEQLGKLQAERDQLAGEVERLEKEVSEERVFKRQTLDKFADYCIERNEHVALLGKLREEVKALSLTQSLEGHDLAISQVLALIDSLTPASKPKLEPQSPLLLPHEFVAHSRLWPDHCQLCGEHRSWANLHPHEAAPKPESVAESEGISLIAEERSRQQSIEGWTSAHDDEHTRGEMALAAICYAAPIPIRAKLPVDTGGVFSHERWIDPWPWEEKWDKRTKHGRVRQLQIAGALIAPEMDRLQRISQPTTP